MTMKKIKKDLTEVKVFGMGRAEDIEQAYIKANMLRAEVKYLRSKVTKFRGDDYDLQSFEALLKKCKKYEETAPSIENIYFFYGDMAHAYLDAKQFKSAMQYTCALIYLSKAWEDTEGYLTGLTAYINIATATNNFDIAIKVFDELFEKDEAKLNGKKNKNVSYRTLKENLFKQKNGEIPLPEFQLPDIDKVETYSKPYSYQYLTGQYIAAYELAVRHVASEMGIGRKAVLSMLCRK